MTQAASGASALMIACLSLATVPTASGKEAIRPGHHALQGQEVAISNIAGEMTVVPSTGSSVEVEITPGGKDASRLTVELTTLKGIPTLRVDYPEDRIVYKEFGYGPPHGVNSTSYFGYKGRRIRVTGSGPGLEAHADMRVLVPRGKRVHLALMVGKAALSEVNGEISFEGASSEVHAERMAGTLAINVGSGDIHVSQTKALVAADTGSGNVTIIEVDGNLSVDAGSGDIDLKRVGAEKISLDSGSGAIHASDIQVTDMSADCGSGEIDMDGAAAERLSLDAGSGSIHLRLTKNIQQLAIDAGSGSVRLEVPEDLNASFTIECPKRHLSIQFPTQIEQAGDDVTVGTIGNGKGRIHIDAGSGRVELVRM